MIVTPQSICNRYFILPVGAGMVMHGQILGPIGHEYSTHYLCDIYPSDLSGQDIKVTSQTIFELNQLAGAIQLFDDEAIFSECWRTVCVMVKKAQRAAARQSRSRRQPAAIIFGIQPPAESEDE